MGAVYAVHITISRTSAHSYQASGDRWPTPYFSILKGRHSSVAQANADARLIALFGSEEHHFDLTWKEIGEGEAELTERKITDRTWLKEKYDAERVEMRGELGWRKITIVYPGPEVQGLCRTPTTYKKLSIFVEQESSESGPREFNDRHRESSGEYIRHQESPRPPPGGRRFNRRERTREFRPPRTFKRERRESNSPGPSFPRRVRRRYSTNFQPYHGGKRESSSRILPKVFIPPRGSSPYHSTSPARQQPPTSYRPQPQSQQNRSREPEAQYRNPPIYNPTLQFSKQLLHSEEMGYSGSTGQHQQPSRCSTVETVILNDEAEPEPQDVANGNRSRSNSTASTRSYSPSLRNPTAPTTPIREQSPVSSESVLDGKLDQAVSSKTPSPAPEINGTAPAKLEPKESELDELRRTILSITSRFETFVSQTQTQPINTITGNTQQEPLDTERTNLANERKALEDLQATLAAERSQIEIDRLNLSRETALLKNLEASVSDRESKLAQTQAKFSKAKSAFDNTPLVQIRQREQNLLALESTLKTKEANIEEIRLSLTRTQMSLKSMEKEVGEERVQIDLAKLELEDERRKLDEEKTKLNEEKSVVKNKAKKLEGMLETWMKDLKVCYTDEENTA